MSCANLEPLFQMAIMSPRLVDSLMEHTYTPDDGKREGNDHRGQTVVVEDKLARIKTTLKVDGMKRIRVCLHFGCSPVLSVTRPLHELHTEWRLQLLPVTNLSNQTEKTKTAKFLLSTTYSSRANICIQAVQIRSRFE